jgi:hypothetical protein
MWARSGFRAYSSRYGSPKCRDSFRLGSGQPVSRSGSALPETPKAFCLFAKGIFSSHAEAKAPPQAVRLPEA